VKVLSGTISALRVRKGESMAEYIEREAVNRLLDKCGAKMDGKGEGE
jgi:hypothetical protein